MLRLPPILLAAAAALLLLLLPPMSVTGQTVVEGPNWIIPANLQPYPAMVVQVGDTLQLSWTQGTHDVWIYPSGICADDTGAIEIGTTADNPTTYTFTQDDANRGMITFVCTIGSHCAAGMIMDVMVLGGVDEVEVLDEDEEETDIPTADGTTEVPVLETEPPVEAVDVGPDTADTDTDTSPPEEPEGPGLFSTCYVCGNAQDLITDPDVVVQLPGGVNDPPNTFFPVSCAELYADGLNGDIPDASCDTIAQLSIIPCGCSPPNFSCNICGDDGDASGVAFESKSPDNTVALPSRPGAAPLVCSDLAAAGNNGTLTPAECSAAAVFAFTPCGCAPLDYTCNVCGAEFLEVLNPEGVIRIPVGVTFDGDGPMTTTCGSLQEQGEAGDLSPQQCLTAAALVRASGCACGPVFEDIIEEVFPTCNICANLLGFDGSNDTAPISRARPLVLSASDNRGTCGDLFDLGLAGGLGPTRCEVAQTQAEIFCNCAPANYTCNVCGTDAENTAQSMLNPEVEFADPNGYIVNCGQADIAGQDGIITPTDCEIVTPLAQANCGCAPVGYTCNICGDSDPDFFDDDDTTSLLSAANVNATFVPGRSITCGDAEALGRDGQYNPTQCSRFSALAQLPDSCGCALPTTAATDTTTSATTIPPTTTTTTTTTEEEQEEEPVDITTPGAIVTTEFPVSTIAVSDENTMAPSSVSTSDEKETATTTTIDGTTTSPGTIETADTDITATPGDGVTVPSVPVTDLMDSSGTDIGTSGDGVMTFDPTAAPVPPASVEGNSMADSAAAYSIVSMTTLSVVFVIATVAIL